MNDKAEMAEYEARAEMAYAAIYDAAPHNVKDYYQDASRTRSRSLRVWG